MVVDPALAPLTLLRCGELAQQYACCVLQAAGAWRGSIHACWEGGQTVGLSCCGALQCMATGQALTPPGALPASVQAR